MGMLYEPKADAEQARTSYEKALQLNPDHEEAQKGQASIGV